PGVVLIAEPWGGGRHHPAWFSGDGWSSWSDRYRDAVKGRDPLNSRGFIFGSPLNAGDIAGDGRMLRYLESHDGYTLGDFIRLGTGEVSPDGRFAGPGTGDLRRLSPRQLALNKFAAMALLTSPGPVMIHEGQEFA